MDRTYFMTSYVCKIHILSDGIQYSLDNTERFNRRLASTASYGTSHSLLYKSNSYWLIFQTTQAMATPNECTDLQTRIQQAKAFLQEHEDESIATAARIFKVSRTSLSSSIHRTPAGRPKGGTNRILTSSQEKALMQFIQSYLDHNLLPTKGVLVSAITHLRRLENKPPPSISWF